MATNGLAVQKMLEEIDQLPDTDASRAIESDLAEFRAKVERGELPPPTPWKPDCPDPFGGNWELFTHVRP
jgi:hypothetical protein